MAAVHVFNRDCDLHILGEKMEKKTVGTVSSNIIYHYQISSRRFSTLALDLYKMLTLKTSLSLPSKTSKGHKLPRKINNPCTKKQRKDKASLLSYPARSGDTMADRDVMAVTSKHPLSIPRAQKQAHLEFDWQRQTSYSVNYLCTACTPISTSLIPV